MKTLNKLVFLAGCITASLAASQVKDSLSVKKIENVIAGSHIKFVELFIKNGSSSFNKLIMADCWVTHPNLQMYCWSYTINDFFKITKKDVQVCLYQ